MSIPPKPMETKAILEAYRAEAARLAAKAPKSPLTRLAEALELLAAGEDVASERREAARQARRPGAAPRRPPDR